MMNVEDFSVLFVWGVTVLIVLVVVLVMIIANLYQKNLINYALSMEQIKIKHENQLLISKVEMHEQACNELSREIHDNIGQKLSLAKLNLLRLSDGGNDQVKFDNTIRIINSTITDLRHLSKSMDPTILLSQGLQNALEKEADELSRIHGFLTTFTVTGQTAFLQTHVELALFRIAQEAVNNIIKHSNAKTILLHLSFSETEVELQVKDNGRGFSIDRNSNVMTQGCGLFNIKNRTSALKGDCKIHSTPGVGTNIVIKIPIQHEQRN
jgi:two-component system, NarL family, sensor kinase